MFEQPHPSRAIAGATATRRDPADLYVRVARIVLPTLAGIAILVAGIAFDDDVIRRIGLIAIFSGIVVGPCIRFAATRFDRRRVIGVSAYVDTILVAFAAAQFEDPRTFAVTYLWGIVVAAMLVGPMAAAGVTVLAVVASLAIPIAKGAPDPQIVVADAVVLLAIGLVLGLIRVGELRAAEERARLEALLEDTQQLAGVGSFEWDGATDTSLWSPEMYRIFGMDGGTPLSLEAFLAALVEEDREPVLAAMRSSMDGRGETRFDARLRTPDGELRSIHAVGKRVSAHDEPPRVMGSVQDVTELRRLDAMREEFVVGASHELRTPTAIIAGFASTLAEQWDRLPEDDRRRFVGEIDSAAGRLSMLIEDVLQVTEIESGQARARSVEFDLWAAAEEVARSWPGDLRIDIEQPSNGPIIAVGDPERTQQVLTNLLANAERLAPPGEPVQLVVADGDGRARLHVRDHGPGIAADDQDRIFERFVRLERDTPGTGLGLYISRRLAEAQGGSLSVESRPGEGATFTLSLPAAVGRVDA